MEASPEKRDRLRSAVTTRTPFASLARAYAANLAGDAFVAVALAGSLFFTVPAESARPNVALYLLVTMTPFALVAPVLGPALDRAKTRRVTVAVGASVGRAVLCLLMARHLHSLLLYPEAFGVLVLMKGFQVTKSSLVPAVVRGRDELVRANSRLTLAGVFGGAIAGVVAVGLLKLFSASVVLVAGALVYLVAARLVTRVPTTVVPEVASSAGDDPDGRVHLLAIRLSAIAMAVLRGGVGFLTFLLAFALKREGEPAWFYGLVIGVSSLGGLVGAVAAPRLRQVLREEAVLVVSLAVPAAAAVLGARSQARPAALIVALALGLGASAGRAGFDSLVQRDAPDTHWGRSFARYEAYFQLAWVLGASIPVLVSISTGFGLIVLALALGAGGFVYLAGLAADSLVGSTGPKGRKRSPS
jgi:MFS-type transporter involved in bile tolerance (Atg22 family)